MYIRNSPLNRLCVCMVFLSLDYIVIAGDEDDNCDTECTARSMKCQEGLFPLIARQCDVLTNLFNCTLCKEPHNAYAGTQTTTTTTIYGAIVRAIPIPVYGCLCMCVDVMLQCMCMCVDILLECMCFRFCCSWC